MNSPIIIHIPHSSDIIPQKYRKSIILSEESLRSELLNMTDRFTDDLFTVGGESVLRFPVSRLICDPERFRDDAIEPMSAVGMGAVYTKCSDGRELRRISPKQREEILCEYYDVHHDALTTITEDILSRFGYCVIIDGHSFSSVPLPYEVDKNPNRPDFCIGTDAFHTPPKLSSLCTDYLKALGYSVELNRPYSGAIVPISYYRREAHVMSIMIEINRRLYMTKSGRKNSNYTKIKRVVCELISDIMNLALNYPSILIS